MERPEAGRMLQGSLQWSTCKEILNLGQQQQKQGAKKKKKKQGAIL